MATESPHPPAEEPSEDAAIPSVRTDQRRPLEYHTLAGLLEDAEQLVAGPHRCVGEWSLGQNAQHLARTMAGSLDGFPKLANPVIRFLARTFFKKQFLYGQEPVRGGFATPQVMAHVRPDDDVTDEQGVAELRDVVRRFEREVPEATSPLFGKLSPEEWLQLHLRHGALHLSHIWPA